MREVKNIEFTSSNESEIKTNFAWKQGIANTLKKVLFVRKKQQCKCCEIIEIFYWRSTFIADALYFLLVGIFLMKNDTRSKDDTFITFLQVVYINGNTKNTVRIRFNTLLVFLRGTEWLL